MSALKFPSFSRLAVNSTELEGGRHLTRSMVKKKPIFHVGVGNLERTQAALYTTRAGQKITFEVAGLGGYDRLDNTVTTADSDRALLWAACYANCDCHGSLALREQVTTATHCVAKGVPFSREARNISR